MPQCSECKHYNPIKGDPAAGWCEFIANMPVPFWIEKYRSAVEKNGADVIATDGQECAAFTVNNEGRHAARLEQRRKTLGSIDLNRR